MAWFHSGHHHHWLYRFLLLTLSILLIILAILDYIFVYQTWFTITINAVIIASAVMAMFTSAFVSLPTLSLCIILFTIIFFIHVVSLIYRGVQHIRVQSWGYGIAMACVLLVTDFVTIYLKSCIQQDHMDLKSDLPTTAPRTTTTTTTTTPHQAYETWQPQDQRSAYAQGSDPVYNQRSAYASGSDPQVQFESQRSAYGGPRDPSQPSNIYRQSAYSGTRV